MYIGILTYHRAHNYGAMLQAYALRAYLRSSGHQVDFVDYWSEEHRKAYMPLRFPMYYTDAKSCIMDWIAWCLTPVRKTIRYNKFEMFSRKYLELPKRATYHTAETMVKEDYDLVIVGSDQIWRNYGTGLEYLGYDSVYFGATVPEKTKLISYAASMGVINPNEEERVFLEKSLGKFSRILVREDNLKELIATLGLKSDTVCDPTLLLTSEQWCKLLPKRRYREHRYLLYYELVQSYDVKRVAMETARAKGLELEIITARVHPVPHKGTNQLASPLDFMQAIRDADFVIATSFHGTAFSVIFEKQFVVAGLGKNAGRVLTLLDSVGIKGRYLPDTNSPMPSDDIDYSLVRDTREEYVKKSKQLLDEALSLI